MLIFLWLYEPTFLLLYSNVFIVLLIKNGDTRVRLLSLRSWLNWRLEAWKLKTDESSRQNSNSKLAYSYLESIRASSLSFCCLQTEAFGSGLGSFQLGNRFKYFLSLNLSKLCAFAFQRLKLFHKVLYSTVYFEESFQFQKNLKMKN